MELAKFDNLIWVLNDYAAEVRSLYKDKLRDNEHMASLNLINGVQFHITRNDYKWSVFLDMEDYWKYVEYNTKPHFPPLQPLEEWVKNKIKLGLLLPTPYNGKLPTEKQLAFLVARKISKVGTKGTHDLEETLEEINAIYEMKIEEALNQDIEYLFNNNIVMF